MSDTRLLATQEPRVRRSGRRLTGVHPWVSPASGNVANLKPHSNLETTPHADRAPSTKPCAMLAG
jgi:hypothetical protein